MRSAAGSAHGSHQRLAGSDDHDGLSDGSDIGRWEGDASRARVPRCGPHVRTIGVAALSASLKQRSTEFTDTLRLRHAAQAHRSASCACPLPRARRNIESHRIGLDHEERGRRPHLPQQRRWNALLGRGPRLRDTAGHCRSIARRCTGAARLRPRFRSPASIVAPLAVVHVCVGLPR